MLDFKLSSSVDHFQFTPEQQILLCSARTVLDAQTQEHLQSLSRQNIDWNELLRLAHQHGVIPLLYLSLKTGAPATAPPIFLKELQLAFQKNAHRSLIWTQELIRLTGLLKSAGLLAVSFKGVVLAASTYGKVSLRQIHDLDLLVDAVDFDQATHLLKQEGYELQVDVPWERHLIKGDYNIDIHKTVAPEHLSASLLNEEIWQNTELFDLKGELILNIRPELMLLVLCLHGTKEGWRKLNRICDVAELLRHTPSLQWHQVMERSRRLGSERLLLLGIQLAMELLDAPVPALLQQKIRSDVKLQTLCQKTKRQLFVTSPDSIDEIERSMFHLQTRERWIDQLNVFRGLMDYSGWFTPTANDRALLSLPNSLTFLYYLLRPMRVLTKYGGNWLGRRLGFYRQPYDAQIATATRNHEDIDDALKGG